MAEEGIAFTLLAPHQVKRVRGFERSEWRDVSDGSIDPRRPYQVRLPSGRSIAVFFYDAPTSHSVAFDGLLSSGEDFAQRLLGIFDEERGPQQLAHIATDGETYGHHHRFGDMALAFVLDRFGSTGEARLTNYGQYLERFPPQHEVEIAENTSWSCGHGVERWRSDCGDSTGGQPGWNQAWRAPLREALDDLRDELAQAFEEKAPDLLRDPWAARDAYVSVVLDRSRANVDAFMAREASRPLSEAERTTALKLLELQHQAMLMFTSCGWFFNDISGIETVQVLAYAGRAAQLAQEACGAALEAGFVERLATARSNVPAQGDGRKIYERYVSTCKVDLPKALAHYAVSSLFEEFAERAKLYQYTVERQDFRMDEAGRTRLAVGLARITSDVTGEERLMSFGVVHLGDQNISGGLRDFKEPGEHNETSRELRQTFAQGELTDVVHALDRLFPGPPFSLRSLFRDEQRKVVGLILQPALEEAESVYRAFYEEHIPLFRFLTHIEFPLPKRFHAAADFALNIELRRNLRGDDIDSEAALIGVEEAKLAGVDVDREALGFDLQQTLGRLAARFRETPSEATAVRRLVRSVDLAGSLSLPVNLGPTQNAVYDVIQATPAAFSTDSEAGRLIQLLCGALRLRMPDGAKKKGA